MKKFAAALLGLMLTAGVASADTIENGYGNTFLVTAADGSVARYYFDAGGVFTATAPDGTGLRGQYEITGDQLCFISPSTQRTCTPYLGDKQVGDTWEQLDSSGNPISITLQAGRP